MSALEAHWRMMARAQAANDVRSVKGCRYPVSMEELKAWIARHNEKVRSMNRGIAAKESRYRARQEAMAAFN